MTAICGVIQRNKILLIATAALFALFLLSLPSVTFAVSGATCTTDADCGTGYGCSTAGTCIENADNTNGTTSDGEAVYDPDDPFGVDKTEKGLPNLGKQSLVDTATSIINIALGLLGIIAVVIVLIGGFKWMTAGGNEDKVAEARKLIFAGIIGLAIIFSAWAITKFVINSLQQATTTNLTP